MRVLINHLSQPPDRITGLTVYTFQLISALLELEEFEYVLATTWSAESLPDELRERLSHIETKRYLKSTALNFIRLIIETPKLLRETCSDVVINVTPIGAVVGGRARLTVVHDLYPEKFPHHYRFSTLMVWKILLHIMVWRSKRLICVSRTTLLDLERYYPRSIGKSVVIYEASPISGDSEMTRRPRATETFVLLVANVTPTKNVEVLVSALDHLNRIGIAVRCLHVGRDEDGILARALDQHASDVIFTSAGPINDESLIEFYRAALCLVVPSKYEGFCLPVLEAQTLGVPVIAADIPTLREVAGDGALFFPPSDRIWLADCIRELIEKENLAQDLTTRGKLNIQRFSWSQAAREIADSIRKSLDQ